MLVRVFTNLKTGETDVLEGQKLIASGTNATFKAFVRNVLKAATSEIKESVEDTALGKIRCQTFSA